MGGAINRSGVVFGLAAALPTANGPEFSVSHTAVPGDANGGLDPKGQLVQSGDCHDLCLRIARAAG